MKRALDQVNMLKFRQVPDVQRSHFLGKWKLESNHPDEPEQIINIDDPEDVKIESGHRGLFRYKIKLYEGRWGINTNGKQRQPELRVPIKIGTTSFVDGKLRKIEWTLSDEPHWTWTRVDDDDDDDVEITGVRPSADERMKAALDTGNFVDLTEEENDDLEGMDVDELLKVFDRPVQPGNRRRRLYNPTDDMKKKTRHLLNEKKERVYREKKTEAQKRGEEKQFEMQYEGPEDIDSEDVVSD